jgi:hypothetical protein
MGHFGLIVAPQPTYTVHCTVYSILYTVEYLRIIQRPMKLDCIDFFKSIISYRPYICYFTEKSAIVLVASLLDQDYHG